MSGTAAGAAAPGYPARAELFATLAGSDLQLAIPEALVPHHSTILQLVLASNFKEIQPALKSFWAAFLAAPSVKPEQLTEDAALQVVAKTDSDFYETITKHLIPDVFNPMDSKLTKQIRSFAKCIGSWLEEALDGFPDKFVNVKINIALSFGQKLRRYTGLNHLVQAAREVLKNGDHVLRMQQDYEKIDFSAVAEQVASICEGCPRETIDRHEAKFKAFQQKECTITQWASWLQGIVAESLGSYDSDEAFAKRGSQLLLRWSFVSSLLIRDLTLRSATSFGPFHLMRLLCDEYMYFLVEAAKLNKGCIPIKHECLKGDTAAILPKAQPTGAKEQAREWLETTFECVRGSTQALNIFQIYRDHYSQKDQTYLLSAPELGELLRATFMLQAADSTNCVEIRRKVNQDEIGSKRSLNGDDYGTGPKRTRIKLEH